jgi:SAM-dependent methyltransferase
MKRVYEWLSWQIDIPISFQREIDSIHVDLGSGIIPRNPFCAHQLIATDIISAEIDAHSTQSGLKIEFLENLDLTKTFPFDSNSISSFSAYDVVEHIPRWERLENSIRFPFVHFMKEIYRCLMPGGFFLAVTPFFPRDATFVDPTHVNHISIKTVDYFCNSDLSQSLTSTYGFLGFFEKVYCQPLRGPGPYLLSNQTLKAIKSQNSVLVTFLKINKRLIKLISVHNPTHLLWVLKKPT